MIKRFLDWIGLKERLHFNTYPPPWVNERELWWISFGENIGSEINGKSTLFSRPGIILKKLSKGFYLVAPTTSQPRDGLWYVKIRQNNKDFRVCLNQIRTVDYKRFSNKLGVVDENDFKNIKYAFWNLYK
jgi:mRNA-degrading endonuclease toxin of MazEF toxin-antitoxin module